MRLTKNSTSEILSLASSIAHEVRNPLAAIKESCQIVKDNLDQAIEFIDLISTTSARGLLISEMILQNIKNGEIDKSGFNELSMADIVRSAIKEFAFTSEKEKNSVNIDLEDDFIFKGDETLMIFALFNLLKNFLYYKANINIWLEANKRDESDGNYYNYLHFKDDGIGINEEKLPHIFDSFFTDGKKEGTGLGLPFCKRVMMSFDGDIFAKSEVGCGVEFILRFPTR